MMIGLHGLPLLARRGATPYGVRAIFDGRGRMVVERTMLPWWGDGVMGGDDSIAVVPPPLPGRRSIRMLDRRLAPPADFRNAFGVGWDGVKGGRIDGIVREGGDARAEAGARWNLRTKVLERRGGRLGAQSARGGMRADRLGARWGH